MPDHDLLTVSTLETYEHTWFITWPRPSLGPRQRPRGRGHAGESRHGLRHPPVPRAQQPHQRRHQEAPDDGRVDRDGGRETEADRLAVRAAPEDEPAERDDHDQGRARDDPPGA